MPHAVEMPAVLSNDTGQMSSQNRPPFELPSHLRHSYEKTNGNARSSSHTSLKGSFTDSLDAYVDGGSVNASLVNGDVLHDGNLSAFTNGRSSASSWENRSSRNGGTMELIGNSNGISENGRRSPGMVKHWNGDRSSITSTNGNSLPCPTSPPPPIPTANGSGDPTKTDSNSLRLSTVSQSIAPAHNTSSLSTANPQQASPPSSDSPLRTAPSSPHRLSSPPTYAAPQSPPLSSSPNAPPPAGPSTLKHRHTLQVPKAGANRNSRDGDDAMYSSGRFSPTSLAVGVRRGSLSLNRRNTQSIHSVMPQEEVPPDEEALRWAEMVRQKRASKRKRKDEEDDDRVVVGTKVDQSHVNWVTAYNMLTGIRFTVSRTNAKMDRDLTDADFDAKHKFSFDITGNELTPSAKYDFKFKDYAPWVFRHLRAKFKLDPADYLMSLTSKYILSELGSPGKSGSFFYFSRDYKYIIKTIHHAEHKFLRKILKEYYSHVEQNPNTLLSQFYGLHRVKIPYGRKIHFVVMNNLFPPHRDIHQTFDLKGSTIGRDFREEDLEKNPRATLKDLNWLRRNLHLEFGPEKKRLFIEQMKKDVHLLQRLKIMDYSMLVGIHDLRTGNQENLRDKTLQVFQPGGDIAEDTPEGRGALVRTPSKLETARKARELRQIIKQEKPIPMGQTSSRMLDSMEENHIKKGFTFYSDDGGFRATHDDNSPGDEIFFLSIIDCLTHYGTTKKLEHLWKGLSNDKRLISPISSEPYGDRFIRFIEGITKSPEEAALEPVVESVPQTNPSTFSNTHQRPAGLGSIDNPRRYSGTVPQLKNQNQAQGSYFNTSNPTIQRAGTEALKPDDSNQEIEPRVISTVRSPSSERNGGMQGQILPIVEEMGEASSTGGRSGRSRERDEGEERPLTPAKDERPVTPAKDYNSNAGGHGSETSSTGFTGGVRMLTKSISRSSLDKELPPLPQP